jgi:GWxTD domain-containing protein
VKKYLFSFLLASSILIGQPQGDRPPVNPIVPFETSVITLPQTSEDYSLFYTYKIPYRLLIFERNNGSFEAEFRIMVEIKNDDGQLVARDIKDNKLTVESFEATNNPELLLQDFLEFKVKPDKYNIGATIFDRNSSGERPLRPIKVDLEKPQEARVLHPIVVHSEDVICDSANSTLLANEGGKIPFSNEDYNLIIPLIDTSITNLEFSLENNNEIILEGILNDSKISKLSITKCDENLVLTESSNSLSTRNFIFKNINKKLNEGELVLKLKNDDNEFDEEIRLMVVWFNKPISLFNSENAIELLTYIESESVVDELLSEDEDDYPKALQKYWQKFDPTPETSFNEIMDEYYTRADYAIREFSSITNNNGSQSDRGRVYIKFGKPDKIDRESNSLGEVIEIWTYEASQRTFSFIDKIGTGNFSLIEN